MADSQNADAAPKAGGSMLGKIFIAGFLGAVVAVECLVAYLLIPDADMVAELAEEKMAQKLPAQLSPDEFPPADGEKTVEVDLGQYSITVSRADSSTALRVDFLLWGTVLEDDRNELEGLLERNRHRFRDQILYEIRNSEPADLADPALGLIKRRILEKSNTLFGKPILRSILFSDFSYVEQ